MAFNTFDSYHLPPYQISRYGSRLRQSGRWLLSTRYGSLGRVYGTGSLERVGLRGTGSRGGYVGLAVEAVGLQSGWMQWTTTKQDSYESRQRMEWMYLMARAWEI